MKVTKQYCDICEKECERLLTIDADDPGRIVTCVNGACLAIHSLGTKTPAFGRNTPDGVWEIELCDDCMKNAIAKLLELKQ